MKIQFLSLLFMATFILSACGGAATDTSNPASSISSSATLPSDPPTSSSSSNRSSSSVASSSSSTVSSEAVSSSSKSSTQSVSSSSAASSSCSKIDGNIFIDCTDTLPSDPPPSSSSSSRSSSSVASSSSSTVSSSCSKIDGNIFIDCTDLAWIGIQAFEQTKDFRTQGIVTNGTLGQIATWRTIVSADQGHNNVIEVQYRDTDTHNALVHFVANTSTDIRDMSAYATGKLMFDIKLLNAGKFSPQIHVMMECMYPCTSHGHLIDIPALNQWTSVEIPIAEFIEGGLKITETGISFQVVPEWNKQNGVQFQLDNIRWVKGTGVAPTPETHCYEQRFETWGLPFHFNTLVGASSLTSGALTQIISTSLMTPNWSSTTDKFGFAPRTDSSFTPCAFTDGKISAQIYAPKSYVDDGKMRVGLYYEDSSARRAYFPSVSAASLTADAWKTISVPLVTNGNAPAFSSTDAAFDINNINYVGVYFDANGKHANVGGMLRVDNIFISGAPVTPSSPTSSSAASSSFSSSSSVSSSSSHSTSSSSSSSTANCSVSAKVAAASPKLGFGITSDSTAYLTIKLSNANYVAPALEVSLANATILLAHSNDSKRVYQLSADASLPQSSDINISFGYQQLDSTANVRLETGLYDTASAAMNESPSNLLHSTNTLITGPANCVQ